MRRDAVQRPGVISSGRLASSFDRLEIELRDRMKLDSTSGRLAEELGTIIYRRLGDLLLPLVVSSSSRGHFLFLKIALKLQRSSTSCLFLRADCEPHPFNLICIIVRVNSF